MKKFVSIIILTLFVLILPATVFGQTAQEIAGGGLDATAGAATLQAGDLPTTIGKAVGALLSILGVVFLVIVIYGGVTWMTAGGEDKKVQKGKDMLIQGAIGLFICLAAYSLSIYVVGKITSQMLQ